MSKFVFVWFFSTSILSLFVLSDFYSENLTFVFFTSTEFWLEEVSDDTVSLEFCAVRVETRKGLTDKGFF